MMDVKFPLLLCLLFVGIKAQFGGPFGFMSDIFGMTQNIQRNVWSNIRNNMDYARRQARRTGGTTFDTSNLRPGERRVINRGNTRGVAFRSADGNSRGFQFSSHSPGGSSWSSSSSFSSYGGPGGHSGHAFYSGPDGTYEQRW